jgi:hypothetical protein
MSLPESKKLVIYEDRKTKSLFIRATRTTEDPKGFAIKSSKFGKALSKDVDDVELGHWVRKILQNSD